MQGTAGHFTIGGRRIQATAWRASIVAQPYETVLPNGTRSTAWGNPQIKGEAMLDVPGGRLAATAACEIVGRYDVSVTLKADDGKTIMVNVLVTNTESVPQIRGVAIRFESTGAWTATDKDGGRITL